MSENIKDMQFREIEGGLMTEFKSHISKVSYDSGTNEEILDSKCCGNVERLDNGKEIEWSFAWDDDESWNIISGDCDQFTDMDDFLRNLSENGLYLENIKDEFGYHVFETYTYADRYCVSFHNVDEI